MIKIADKKRLTLVTLIVAVVIGGIIWGIMYFRELSKPENQPRVYEAMVNVVDQKSSDPAEDARSSLKKGDVITYFPEGHNWSDTEKNSYLIVKIKLRPKEALKLLEAVTKEVKRDKGEERGVNGKEIKDMGPQMETVVARKYRLKLPDFDLQKFWGGGGQPFEDQVFDAKLIEKK